VYIMDMSKPTTPSVFSPGVQKHSANVTSVGWNPKVVHILASAAADGVCTVWDLRKKAPFCELRDPKGRYV
jgi:WD40 repeat protein